MDENGQVTATAPNNRGVMLMGDSSTSKVDASIRHQRDALCISI
uniref:Uncharacterized protein n=1 Tax=Arundo donax TaxID=35708 RepID=A0A0A9B1R8_ARUDO